MKNSNKSYLTKFIIIFVLFICFTVLIKVFDVKNIGPLNSEVGFASINESFHDLTSYNDTFYKISEVLGYISFGIIALYGITGLIQLIKRKSLFKVDKELLILGGFYIFVLFLYVLFDKLAINYILSY